ncbi:MAG: glycerol kinase, partial [Clostridia bacterium]|nr:glycerol kinase [Clostridia bacterium]
SVNRPLNIETTAQGVAFMAGLGAGIFSSKEEIKNLRKTERLFKPEISTEARERLITDWHNGIGRTITK